MSRANASAPTSAELVNAIRAECERRAWTLLGPFDEGESLGTWTVSTSTTIGAFDDLAAEFPPFLARHKDEPMPREFACIDPARLAALEQVASAARIEVERADRFGCKELRDALNALDGSGE